MPFVPRNFGREEDSCCFDPMQSSSCLHYSKIASSTEFGHCPPRYSTKGEGRPGATFFLNYEQRSVTKCRLKTFHSVDFCTFVSSVAVHFTMLRIILLFACLVAAASASVSYYQFSSNVNNATITIGQSNIRLYIDNGFGPQSLFSPATLGVGYTWEVLMNGQVGYTIYISNIDDTTCKYAIVVGVSTFRGQTACTPFIYTYKSGNIDETITIS